MNVYSPQVLDALAESLRTIYWFQDDLKTFLVRCGVSEAHVARLPWKYKRSAVTALVNELAQQGPSGMALLKALVGGAVEQPETFPHLARIDDGGPEKVRVARQAVRRLKDLLGHETVVERAEEARRERRTEAARAQGERQERTTALAKLRERFLEMHGWTDEQKRGFAFQIWLRELFELHDLEPRGSFASPGEQIDGSVRVDGQLLLVEARWTVDRVAPEGVRDFVGKFEDKLDTTLGVMVSVNGFTDNASQKATRSGRLLAIFVDGADLFPVLEGHIDLKAMLQSKLRHAAEKGEPLYRVGSR